MLEPEQIELLVSLVQTDRKLPYKNRGEFIFVKDMDGSSVGHEKLPNGGFEVSRGDLEALEDEKLIKCRPSNSNLEFSFSITPRGSAYFDFLTAPDQTASSQNMSEQAVQVEQPKGGALKPLTKDAVYNASLQLIKEIGSITTLDVKNRLRELNYHAIQSNVSSLMLEIAMDKSWQWVVQEDHRVYSLPTASNREIMSSSKKVFIIHGHDKLTLDKVENTLWRIGCEPIVFSRIHNRGAKTNIEILESALPTSDAVVALLTPDDEGRKKGIEKLELRARQNVLIEAGYALISRRKTSLIVALGGVSIPSDLDGINRLQFESWNRSAEIDLSRELGSILEFEVDVNRI